MLTQFIPFKNGFSSSNSHWKLSLDVAAQKATFISVNRSVGIINILSRDERWLKSTE